MAELTPQLLELMASRLGGLAWSQRHLASLLDPKFGLITGFAALVTAVKRLNDIDLGETPLPHEDGKWQE